MKCYFIFTDYDEGDERIKSNQFFVDHGFYDCSYCEFHLCYKIEARPCCFCCNHDVYYDYEADHESQFEDFLLKYEEYFS